MSVLKLGDWRALLFGCTPEAKALVKGFCEYAEGTPFITPITVEEGPCYLVIASPSIPTPQQIVLSQLPAQVAPYWSQFHRVWAMAAKYLDDTPRVEPGVPITPNRTFAFSWSPPGDNPDHVHFDALVIKDPDEYAHIKIFGYSLNLATWWHVQHKGLLLHASAAARNGAGILFLGKSEAGKSTAAQLSASIGIPILGDDLNFILHDQKAGYQVGAGPSSRHLPAAYAGQRPPLKMMCQLVQDDRDYLVPLPPIQVAQLLFDSLMQTPSGPKLSDELTGVAFQTLVDIARTIPGYELHFRKTPAFWDVIDAELGR